MLGIVLEALINDNWAREYQVVIKLQLLMESSFQNVPLVL